MPVPLAIPLAVGGAAFLKWLAGNSANNTAMDRGYDALNKAQGAIEDYSNKAVALQQPYLQNAGADYARQRGLVQSGYYQTPYGQSFTPQQNTPQGFSFNPSQGSASFSPFQGLVNSFTPQGLPPMPNFPAPQGPAQGPAQAGGLPKLSELVARSLQQQTRPVSPMPGMAGGNVLNTSPTGNFNPQTGQNNPLTAMGVKPADPRFPTQWDLFQLAQKHPWLAGGSGPMEGGMPRGGLL
jgi:hypothetical protein